MTTSTDHGQVELDGLRADLALACRILAAAGCVREITGHVSSRISGSDDILVRCRRPEDPGVEFTTSADIQRVRLDATNADLSDGYILPGEFVIHTEIYRARSDVVAVVHGHPEASLLCGISGVKLLPIFGAYDPAAMRLAVEGVPLYPRSVLIQTRGLGSDLASTLGDKTVCLLAGHGVVATGDDIKVATVNAIKLETLADLNLKARAAASASSVSGIDAEDIREVSAVLDRPGAESTYARWTWDFYSRKLSANAGPKDG